MELGFDPLIILRLKTLQKFGVALCILTILAGGYWYFFLQERLDQMETLRIDVRKQEQRIRAKRRMLQKLPQLREELAKLKIKEAKAAQKLPSKKEIPTLLTNISTAGHEQGLEFLRFAPKPEINHELYAEVPVDLEVRGSFHSTVRFLDQVAKFSRIVTFADMSLEPMIQRPGRLVTKARATTYRFLEKAALAQQDENQKGKTEK